jgi:carboxylesterase type B
LKAPTANASAIDDGSVDRKCPSHKPNWFSLAPQTIVPLFTGRGDAINSTALQSQLDAMNAQTTQEDSKNATIGSNPENSETEDCLFLDVYSPKDAFEEVESTYGRPVLVCIHSGGYIWGSKHDFTTAGLFQRAASTGPPMVMVALNYRLGALGFLSGPTIQKDGLANAGLHDQRFALEWIQKNIHLFGGDRNKVTVWGGSAGAGSIMQQITVSLAGRTFTNFC